MRFLKGNSDLIDKFEEGPLNNKAALLKAFSLAQSLEQAKFEEQKISVEYTLADKDQLASYNELDQDGQIVNPRYQGQMAQRWLKNILTTAMIDMDSSSEDFIYHTQIKAEFKVSLPIQKISTNATTEIAAEEVREDLPENVDLLEKEIDQTETAEQKDSDALAFLQTKDQEANKVDDETKEADQILQQKSISSDKVANIEANEIEEETKHEDDAKIISLWDYLKNDLI